MNKLIETDKSAIIYGDFRGEPNQELFRCPIETKEPDLKRYINEYRCLVNPMESDIPFENDDCENLRDVNSYSLIGYYRMYFSGGWSGTWLLEGNDKPDTLDCIGVDNIIQWFAEHFPKGCNYAMTEYFKDHFKEWGSSNRYLIRPFMSKYYKIMVDTTYGNGDYPVRIYTYKEKVE